MKKYNVTFEIFMGNNTKTYKVIFVEAGSKKIATLRAMSAINKEEGYSDLFKNVIKVEEVRS